MKRVFILVMVATLMMLLGVVPAVSQEGHGLVITNNIASLYDYVVPFMYAHDPLTGVLTGAAPHNFALVLDGQSTAEQEQTLHLRDDLLWSDGTPISAYDVLYTLITGRDNEYDLGEFVESVAITDSHTLTVRYTMPNCANAARTNFSIVPSHARDFDFPAFVQAYSADHPGLISLHDWRQAALAANLFEQARIGGIYFATGLRSLPAERTGERLRYTKDDLAILYVNTSSGVSSVDQFLRGDTNLLLFPDINRRADLLAHDDLQIYDAPDWSIAYLTFNFADTTIPRSAYTTRGELLDQGHNQFFSDKRLRHAVQLGIDVNAIIEVVFQGGATPIAGTLSPNSWGYNPDLQPTVYDPGMASRLLDEAGWVDTDGDGIRNCFRCTTAEPGTSLTLRFIDAETVGFRGRAAEMIALQLGRIGIGVSNIPAHQSNQQFDLFLGSFNYDYTYFYKTVNRYAYDPDQTALFTRGADVVGSIGNPGSYYNPALEDLLAQARTVPDCDINTRAALYREAQALLADDLPMFGLYVRHEMFVARGIQGFDPQPGNPFWNLLNWKVSS
ncbi:MAG: hypothetical protein H6672_02335 [Anaerolineaceae bacterium]|nr:hypothetical protein [Anaerolineaceae bacterium]